MAFRLPLDIFSLALKNDILPCLEVGYLLLLELDRQLELFNDSNYWARIRQLNRYLFNSEGRSLVGSYERLE
jgi:hypothetical protein